MTVEKRLCPECSTEMQTISVDFDKKIEIEKCPNCEGLFFDNQELQDLVSILKEYPVETAKKIDNDKDYLKNFDQSDYKCPVCGEKMLKAKFGATSGVTFDYCLGHGVYLNKGELIAIIRWKKENKIRCKNKTVEDYNNRVSEYRENKAKSKCDKKFDSNSRIIDIIEFFLDWFIWE